MKRVLFAAALLFACQQAVPNGNNPKNPGPSDPRGGPGGGALSALSKEEQETVKSLSQGNNQLAFDLYKALREEPGNLFFSPSSLSTALAMTYAGARGETALEMKQTLHFTLADEELHPAFASLLKQMNAGGEGYTLSVANRLWGQKSYSFEEPFLKATRDHYGAELATLDFEGDTEGARREINGWVAKETQDKIKDLLPESSLASDTRLVLTNAIYFKGDWKSEFDKSRTSEQAFFVGADKTVQVPMMFQENAAFRSMAGDGFQMLEMPYVGDEVSMLVLLPHGRDGLAALEAKLSQESLDAWVGKLSEGEISVSFPKFSTRSRFELSDALSRLGMPAAFAEGVADFSGMTKAEKLFISKVFHEAFVKVDEEGTEAAGATAVVMRPESAGPIFRADHPFVFVLRDTRSGNILFLGRLVDPS